jgi:hypothetical protein
MRNIFLLIPILFAAGSCSKNTADSPPPILVQSKAMLTSPAQNEPCTSGSVISYTQSAVQFKWNKAENADSYDIVIKNLLTGLSKTYSAGSELQEAIALDRNVPYSWYVLSKFATINLTVQSDTWKFYNPGPASMFYAPYPADAMLPAFGQNISATNGKITLSWKGTDADNDIVGYDVYFGTTAIPALLSPNITNSTLADLPVNSNIVYYWKVVTKDAKGNTSNSGIYQFKIN